MKFHLEFSPRATEELKELPAILSAVIVKKLKYFSAQKNPLTYAKPLHGRLDGLYRFRIGDYRAIFEKQANGQISILYILKISHRRDIYE